MATTIIVRQSLGFSDNPTFDALIAELANQANEWHKTQTADAIRKYHVVLKCLWELGWDEELDLELELPYEHMPAEYFARHNP